MVNHFCLSTCLVTPKHAILQYCRCYTLSTAMPFQGGQHFPKMVRYTSPAWHLASHRHICAIPHFVTYHAIIPRYPLKQARRSFAILSLQVLGSVSAERIFREFLFLGRRIFFAGFCRRMFSSFLRGNQKIPPEKSSKRIPDKILPNLYNKNPRHRSAEGPDQQVSPDMRSIATEPRSKHASST